MTRRALPKPVEAWVLCDAHGAVTRCLNGLPILVESRAAFQQFHNDPGHYIIRVRIVPITPKKRTKRKAANPSKWTIGMTKKGVHAPHPSTRTKRKEKK